MNAKSFMGQGREAQIHQEEGKDVDEAQGDAEDEVHSAFWPWFALGILMFCWIAEASMCAERGF